MCTKAGGGKGEVKLMATNSQLSKLNLNMSYCRQRHTKLALFFLLSPLLWVCSADGTGNQLRPAHLRLRRQTVCQDGNYTVNEMTCCMCSAGERLLKDCTADGVNRVCERCKNGDTFKSVPNHDATCEKCTHCGQPNAHLEVKEDCTPAKNTVCQCQKGFYCPSQPCFICNPCKMCVTAIKSPCTQTTNTVCEDKTEGLSTVSIVFLILFSILSPILILCTIYCRMKKLVCFKKCVSKDPHERHPGSQQRESMPLNETTQEMPDGDLTPKIPEIAGVIGWGDMRSIALASGMTPVFIEDIQRNTLTRNEQTIDLLIKWTQSKGKAAPNLLVNALRKMERIDTVEKVQDIILQN